MSETTHRDYLGDGVYIGFDGQHVILVTSDGINATNTIFLDPNVTANLRDYIGKLPWFRKESR